MQGEGSEHQQIKGAELPLLLSKESTPEAGSSARLEGQA
jgi:hypothetical protein